MDNIQCLGKGKMNRWDIFKETREVLTEMGGKGSGHHGHAGRKGKRGGSAPSRAGASPKSVLGSKRHYEPSSEVVNLAKESAVDNISWAAQMMHLTEEEVVAKVEGQLKEDLAQPLAIRRGVRGATSVVEDGRFKTQYETGMSTGGLFNPGARADAERKGLGVPSGLPVEQRPVYAYFKTDRAKTSAYGPVEFILKDSVRERTTYTLGDSLGAFGTSRLVGGVSPTDQAAWGGQVRRYLDGHLLYIEAQVQGGISLGDVARVVIHGSPREYASLHSGFDAKGIEVVFDE